MPIIKENNKQTKHKLYITLFNLRNHINNLHYIHFITNHYYYYNKNMNILKLYRKYHREYMIMILCGAVVFLFADQNLMSPNLSLIAQEFHFTDIERGQRSLWVVRCLFVFLIISIFVIINT